MPTGRPVEFNWMSQLTPEHKQLLNQLVRAGCHVRTALLEDTSVRVSVSYGRQLLVERSAGQLTDAFGTACGEARRTLFGDA